ncbi:hypothetical protein LTR78_008047 [Recurvomyces mirabilis]|uniref:Heterokaryon incompatibility domain-containing protein n=1 Tax=Recurvomyces mirabilis TaxID=574656 RepID=A0AAE0WJ12_9PEZI|nr:hypothetical protein LTR78_008047 [Recurvomyces mirabilis]KAK5150775.1 hypothetical protein LTS14_009838 [Recurvomyces mirabilis]
MLEEATGFAVVSSDLGKGASLEVRPLGLEMSYFQHGQWTSRVAYIPINVGLDILPLTDPSDFCGTTVQDLLRSYKETAEAVAEWSRTCIRDHEERAAINRRVSGTGQGRDARPTRLLDICSLAAEQKVRPCGHNTYLTDNENGYVTLSHCRGPFLPTRLLTTNFAEFCDGIKIERLPRTFQDAIAFTRSIDVRYLWIDALCIVKDSQEDWLRESLRMVDAYSNSIVNLVATASTDGTGGSFVEKYDPSLSLPLVVNATWTGHAAGRYACLDQSAYDWRIDAGTLNKRAWVFQERVLAPRTVHFAQDQRSACDIRRKLERIAMTAQRLAKWKPSDYAAGLRRQEIEVAMLWHLTDAESRSADMFVAPSWSWPSVRGSMEFTPLEDWESVKTGNLSRQILLLVLCTSRWLPSEDPLVSLRTIELWEVRFDGSASKLYCMSINERTKLKQGENPYSIDFFEALDHEPMYQSVPPNGLDAVFCRFMTAETPHLPKRWASEGLIQQPTPHQPPGHYVRIGRLKLFHDDKEHIFDAARKQHLSCLADHQDGTFTIDIV